jgi:DNA polymerase-3 subunit delta'
MQFADIIGHEDLKSRLISSAKEGRISHAQLFLGPEGSGNLPMAIAYAQYLFCENKGVDDSCGACPSCIKIRKLVHPDLTFSYPVAPKPKLDKPRSVDFVTEWREAILYNPYISYQDWIEHLDVENKQGQIAVHEAIDILNRLSLKSVEGGYKIVILWLPETLNTIAANKLLKVIEEPPDHTIFILVAEDYEQIIQTITSRTQLIKVSRLSENDLIPALVKIHGLEHAAARHIAHRANGNYNEALKLIRNDETDSDLNQWFLFWMRACYSGNVSQIIEFTNNFAAEPREKQKGYLQHALNVARECLLINYGDRSMVHFEGKELEDLERFAPFVNVHNADDFVSTLSEAAYHIERNASDKVLFTDLSFTIQSILHRKN